MYLKNELVHFCHKVYEKEFVAATDGNLSVRLPDGTFLITSSGISKGEVTVEDIIHTDRHGNTRATNKKISTEFKMHLEIYRARPEINAVVHCHPVHATAFASSNRSLNRAVLPEAVLGLGRIALCEYATPSTRALAESLQHSIDYANVFLLRNHGAVTVGTSLREAYNRMEKLEHTAKVLWLTESLGGAIEISKDKLEELYSVAAATYGMEIHPKNRL
ncbi:MAG: class II aldolase/adducin family protein [Ignavibacteria bacterium]|nr:class II aldolase/adducin family protein [Ignavibacteria bacterium]